MAHISKRFRDAYENNIDLCSERYDEWIAVGELMGDYIQSLFPNLKVNLSCSTERLQDAAISYFYDIYRYKDFHGMLDDDSQSLINFQKVYAFGIKWLLKEKPFYLELLDDSNTDDELYLEYASTINEDFALNWVVLSYQAQTKVKIEFPEDEWNKLIYTFKFRDTQTSLLELIFQSKGIRTNVTKTV
jgi:hypothetical protein